MKHCYMPPKEKIAQFDNAPVACLFVNPALLAKLIAERRKLSTLKYLNSGKLQLFL